MRNHHLLLTVLLALPLLAGCNADDAVGPGDGPFAEYDFDVDAILHNEANNVITATYANLADQTDELNDAVTDLEANPSSPQLKAARKAWRGARVPWEQSESFLFGPVATEKLDPALDSWPTDQAAIQKVLNGDQKLTASFIDGLAKDEQGGRKGFHTIELFLFGKKGHKKPNDFSERELTYLSATTQVLHRDAVTLANAWQRDGDDFADQFASGHFSSTKKAALEELAENVTGIANEVATIKINAPLNANAISDIESKYSENSFTDFANNIRSLRHIYTGVYDDHTGPGLNEIVREVDPGLHDRFSDDVQKAIEKIEAAGRRGSFRSAIEKNDTAPVAEARNAVLDVRDTARKVSALIANL